MHNLLRLMSGFVLVGGIVVAVSMVFGQPPGRPGGGPPGGGPRSGSASGDVSTFIARMMKFDANEDGKLSKDEITDTRLLALFERADTDNDGIVTKEELTAIFGKESADLGRGAPGGGGPGGGGPGGRGPGRNGGGPGGRDGPGGPGGPPPGPPPIGMVLPPHIQEMLNLTKAQTTKLDALQKRVDTALAEILTDEQKQQLEEFRNLGPGFGDGFGPPPGGPGGPGGPRGNRRGPPDDDGRPPRPPE